MPILSQINQIPRINTWKPIYPEQTLLWEQANLTIHVQDTGSNNCNKMEAINSIEWIDRKEENKNKIKTFGTESRGINEN